MALIRPLSKVLAVLVALSASAAMAAPSLVPIPAQIAPQSGEFTLSAATPLTFGKQDAFAAKYLRDLLKRTRGIGLATSNGPGAITLRRDPQV